MTSGTSAMAPAPIRPPTMSSAPATATSTLNRGVGRRSARPVGPLR